MIDDKDHDVGSRVVDPVEHPIRSSAGAPRPGQRPDQFPSNPPGLDEERTVYLEDTGHMSGVDNLLGLERLHRAGRLRDGDAVLLLAAGIGYTWAATVLRWGAAS